MSAATAPPGGLLTQGITPGNAQNVRAIEKIQPQEQLLVQIMELTKTIIKTVDGMAKTVKDRGAALSQLEELLSKMAKYAELQATSPQDPSTAIRLMNIEAQINKIPSIEAQVNKLPRL